MGSASLAMYLECTTCRTNVSYGYIPSSKATTKKQKQSPTSPQKTRLQQVATENQWNESGTKNSD